MAETKLSENQTLIRLIVVIVVIAGVVWLVDRHHQPATAPATPGSTDTSGVNLTVQSPSGSTSADPQETTSPSPTSTNQIQSGQSDLQPAGDSAQMPADLKQELGL